MQEKEVHRMAIKEWIKKNKLIVKMYEDIYMFRTFWKARKNAEYAKSLLTEKEIAKIKSYHNIHAGERCFIVGSGPSLTSEDLELIKNEYSFSVNTCYRAYENTDWRADYYLCVDDNAVGYIKEALEYKNTFKGMFCSVLAEDLYEDNNFVHLPVNGECVFNLGTIQNKLFPKLFPEARFSEDITQTIYCGKTVVYPCIELAAYMGFKEIYLLGVDCNYSAGATHTKMMSYQIDDSGMKSLLVSEQLMKQQLGALADVLKSTEVFVYNATRGGALEAFPRVTLEEVLSK